MRNELLKIRKEKYIKIIIVLLVILTLIVTIAPINSFSFIENSEQSNEIKGREAIEKIKQQYEMSKGELTVDKLNQVLKYYQSFPDPLKAELESDFKYPGVIQLLLDAYGTYNKEIDNLYHIDNVNDFYNKNSSIITGLFQVYKGEYSSWEKKEILQRAKSIHTPYYFDFHKQWINLFKSLTIIGLFLAVVAILIGANLYSYEMEMDMDYLLGSCNTKQLKRIAQNKLFSMYAMLSILFFGSIIFISIVDFIVFGIRGYNSPIQIAYFTSIYHLNFGEAFIIFIFLEWIGILAISSISAIINSFYLKTIQSVFIAIVFNFIPIILNNLLFIKGLFRKILFLFPVYSMMYIRNINNIHIYRIGGLKFLGGIALFIVCFMILIFAMIIVPKIFTKRFRIIVNGGD